MQAASAGYVVSKRGTKGEPTQIQCVAHPGCGWSMASSGAKPDDDPIFQAQHAHHIREAMVPDLQVLGVLRKVPRKAPR